MQKTLDKLKTGGHPTLVALGDSNTEITFHLRGELNWVGLLSAGIFQKHGANACTMINSSRSGGTCAEALTRLERDVLRFEPDLVIIAFGMNDATTGLDGLPAFRNNLHALITDCRRECDSEILLRTSNPVVAPRGIPLPDGSGMHTPGQPYESPDRPLSAYAKATLEIAEALECSVVDHYSLWCNQDFPDTAPVANPNALWMRMSDAIHPNGLGHRHFYRELAPVFELPIQLPWDTDAAT